MRQEKKDKYYKEIKLFLFADDRIVHTKVPKESTNELLELIIVNLARPLYTTKSIYKNELYNIYIYISHTKLENWVLKTCHLY